MHDIGLTAFSVFLMQSPSFLSHRRPLSEGRGIPSARTPFGMDRIPCDNHIRQMLDGVPPEHFDGVFSAILADPEESGALYQQLFQEPGGTMSPNDMVLLFSCSAGYAVSGRACSGGIGRLGAFSIPQAALRAVLDAPYGQRDGVFPQIEGPFRTAAGSDPHRVGSRRLNCPERALQCSLAEPVLP